MQVVGGPKKTTCTVRAAGHAVSFARHTTPPKGNRRFFTLRRSPTFAERHSLPPGRNLTHAEPTGRLVSP
jgi:hypothetical protein